MTLVGRWRARRLAPAIAERAADLDAPAPAAAARQLRTLNAEWRRILDDVPYYRDLARERRLPDQFESLEQFAARVPATTRSEVQAHAERMTSTSRRPDLVRMTGGSTASPVQVKAWHSEIERTGIDQWVARGWHGVTPASRLFLLWGHSHVLGAGWRGWLNAKRRHVQDALLGYLRVSAYDLRGESLRRAADALLRFRPDYAVGYGVALDLFARENRDRASELRRLGLRAVVATAEALPAPDSAALIEELFGRAPAMEYGAAEVGIIAHTVPGGGYRTLWSSLLLEAELSSPGRHTLRVTSLYPRCVPLVRYELGDEIELPADAPGLVVGLTTFCRVVGRCNDYVVLADGTRIHSEAFTHAVRHCSTVRAYQVVHGDTGVRIRYTAVEPLAPEELTAIRARLARVHPALGVVGLEHVEALPQTRAGKTRMVVAEPEVHHPGAGPGSA